MFYQKSDPISLATTFGISVDFFSFSYLDVSLRQVNFLTKMFGFPLEICKLKYKLLTTFRNFYVHYFLKI